GRAEEPLRFSARRYARRHETPGRSGPVPSGPSPSGPWAALRFRGDLKRLLAGAGLPRGLLDLRLEVRGPLEGDAGAGAVLASVTERIAVLPPIVRCASARGFRLGLLLDP